jgi:hypothetical protein
MAVLPKEFKVISLRASAKKIAEALPRQTRKLSKKDFGNYLQRQK